jgi:hypothetical protein
MADTLAEVLAAARRLGSARGAAATSSSGAKMAARVAWGAASIAKGPSR